MEIGDALVAVADKLGIGLTEIYKIYVQAQMIQGVGFIITTIFGACVAYALFNKTYDRITEDNTKKDEYNQTDTATAVCYSLVAGFIGFLFIGVIGSLLVNGVLEITNPEYSAIKELISTVK